MKFSLTGSGYWAKFDFSLPTVIRQTSRVSRDDQKRLLVKTFRTLDEYSCSDANTWEMPLGYPKEFEVGICTLQLTCGNASDPDLFPLAIHKLRGNILAKHLPLCFLTFKMRNACRYHRTSIWS